MVTTVENREATALKNILESVDKSIKTSSTLLKILVLSSTVVFVAQILLYLNSLIDYIFTLLSNLPHPREALNSLIFGDVPLRNYLLAHSLVHTFHL